MRGRVRSDIMMACVMALYVDSQDVFVLLVNPNSRPSGMLALVRNLRSIPESHLAIHINKHVNLSKAAQLYNDPFSPHNKAIVVHPFCQCLLFTDIG